MRLASEVTAFVRFLQAAVVLLAFGAVALFGRMSPAIQEILSDNVSTLIAAERMLAALAADELDEADFEEALGEARANVTEAGEGALLEKIEAQWTTQGERDRRALVEALRGLSEMNRASMEAADREAERLGGAGAWAVVILSLVILGVVLFFQARMEARVVDPLSSIEEVVAAAEAGRGHRRCAERGPPELRRIAAGLNRLLDLAARWRSSGPDRRPANERALLTHLLATREGEWAVLDEQDEVLFASDGAWPHIEDGEALAAGTAIFKEEVVVANALRLVQIGPAGEGAPLETVEPDEPDEANEPEEPEDDSEAADDEAETPDEPSSR